MNCIVNHYTVWTDDTMIAIAEDRFEGMQSELSIPTRLGFLQVLSYEAQHVNLEQGSVGRNRSPFFFVRCTHVPRQFQKCVQNVFTIAPNVPRHLRVNNIISGDFCLPFQLQGVFFNWASPNLLSVGQ